MFLLNSYYLVTDNKYSVIVLGGIVIIRFIDIPILTTRTDNNLRKFTMISNVADLIFSIDMVMASIVGFILAIITLYLIFQEVLYHYWQATIQAIQERFGHGANNDVNHAGRLIARHNLPRYS